MYVGTLRPLYAQALQRSTLSDLGRVGLSVAPALGVTARAKVFLKRENAAPAEHKLDGDKAADCYVVPGCGGTDKPVVLFKRRFVTLAIDLLLGVDPKGCCEGCRQAN